MTAGPALERCNVAGFNCAYLPIDSPRSFDELFYILLCGTGVGYSVERQYVDQLPRVSEVLSNVGTTIVVGDSKAGWASSLKELIHLLYSGSIPKFDVSGVRPAGSRLKTFGGRSSGPAPLLDCFEFFIRTFQNAAGRRLTSLECHDLCCKIADIVVVGGVRRAALISLSNMGDGDMRHCKSGSWYNLHPHRALANNSIAYTSSPSVGTFMAEWVSLYESKSGERGIFNRVAATEKVKSIGRRDPEYQWGTNPCSEIILRPFQFCNLTEAVVRAGDSAKDVKAKVELASILGTMQSTLTDFKYLRKRWRANTEEERLLGVSLTGICDNPITYSPNVSDLEIWKHSVIEQNAQFASKLGIASSTATTCVKPSGTVSQLVDSASGIHTRHSQYYIRTVRGDNKDPITKFMIERGVPCEPDVTKPDNTTVFSFPQRSPEGSLTRDSLTPIEHLDLWKLYQDHWCEHKPSITVSVKEKEWPEVQAWVWKNFDSMSGVSFLPHSEHSYKQAPYQECSEGTYKEMLSRMPNSIDWSELSQYETDDNTASSQTLACSGTTCELVDIGSN